MAIIDDRTPRLNLPIPVRTNALKDDVGRLRDAFTELDEKVATVGDDGKLEVEQLPEFQQNGTGSVSRPIEAELRDHVSVKQFGAIGDGTLHKLSERFETLALAKATYPFATSLDQSIDWAALQAAMDTGKSVYAPSSDYVLNYPVLTRTIGQKFFGDGMGYGYGNRDEWWKTYQAQTRFIIAGGAARRLMTQRKIRTAASDPTDDLFNAAFEVHAEGVTFEEFAIWLDCDYSDATPTNKGADVDFGIFVGSRCGFKAPRVGVFGYFRKAGIMFDVTRAPGDLPELNDPDGNPLPVGIPFHGGDGTVIDDPYVRGANIGIAILGAVHSDAGYWNEKTGALIPDTRGASGFSDFRCHDGRLYPGYHHSGYRLKDPSVSPLTRAGMEAEDIWSPASIVVDGWSANASTTTHGVGAIRGIIFDGTRFTSAEIFRVRLRTCDEVYFTERCWVEGGTGTTYDTNGNVVNVSDYAAKTYGHISADDALTGSVYAKHVTGGLFQKWISAGKWSGSNSYGTYRFRGVYNQADSSLIDSQMLALDEVRDLAGSPTKFTRATVGYKPSDVLIDLSAGTWGAGWVNDTGFMDLCYSSNPKLTADLQTGKAYRLRLADNAAQFLIPHQLPSYTVANLPAIALTVGAGFPVYCSNGDGGNPCLAVNAAGIWRRIPLDSTVSTTAGGGNVGTINNIKATVWTATVMYTATVGDFSGVGSPEGVVTASPGSEYRRTDGAVGTFKYQKQSGTGNTGWVAIA